MAKLDGTIEWHTYDVDLNRALRQMRSEIELGNYSFPRNKALIEEDYIKLQESYLKVFYESRHTTSANFINSHAPFIIDNTDPGYESAIGYTLIPFEIYLIPFYLDYQKKQAKNKQRFVNMIEYITFNYIRWNCPFNVDSRLERISYWLEKQKERITANSTKKTTYNNLLKTLYDCGTHMEGNPNTYIGMDEPGMRSQFELYLHNRFPDAIAYREGENRKGKTDLMLTKIGGRHIFIGECKIWKSEDELKAGITQVLNNGTANNQGLVLIVFVKNVGYGTVVEKINQIAKSHNNHIDFVKARDEYSFSYVFSRPTDNSARIKLEIMTFHFDMKKNKNSTKKINID